MNVSKARDFALKAHSGMMYGNRAYSFHLEAVVGIARKFGLEEEVVASCWLHDTIEDCEVSYQDIKKEFGTEIAEIVYAVTDELGRNRRERKSKTYLKIRSNEHAVCVKLCDRIANISQALEDDNKRILSMYAREQDEFREQLQSAEQSEKTQMLWLELDKIMESVNAC